MTCRLFSLFLLTLCAALTAAGASAQQLEVQIERDALAFQAELDTARTADRDSTDTALVFTNSGHPRAKVRCVGFDHDGRIVGRAYTVVPGLGLRYVTASDLSNGRDFVGSVQCSTPGHLIGSAVLLAPGAITALQVKQGDHSGQIRIRFPVVASY